MALSYAFSPDKGETPETIARRRQTADLIASRIFGKAPANVGEGLNAIGQALIARQMASEATDAQKAGMASVPALFGGTGANPAAGIAASIAGQPIAPTVATPAGQTSIPGGSSEFTNTVMPLAEDASAKTGVDPRLITAQAILETGNGKSAPGNNLFGIKSHGQPGGNVLPTTEVVNGQPVRTTDSFAAYASPQDSANGYSNFLQSNPRYKPMMAAPTLEGQAAALGQSGYATDPNYGSKVLGIAKGLPAPTGGILADNSASPLDNAQYPAGPVGAPTQAAGALPAAPANDGEDAIPTNAAPAQGALPTAQAVQAASQPRSQNYGGPFANISTAELTKAAFNPWVKASSPVAAQALAAEISRRATMDQQANDPAHQLDIQAKQLAVKKAQQDSEKSDFEWKPVGRDANGQWSYGWVNSKTQEVRDRNGKPMEQGQQPTEDATAGLMGEDYLKAIPRDRADIARKVANGEIDVTSLPNRGNYRMQVLSDAARFDPTFNPADYKTRLATRKDFTSGKSAQNITSFNTAIGHLDSLDQSIDKLGNRGSSWYNAATAPISEQTDPKYQVALKDFRTSKQAVIDELTRAFRGSGGNVHDLLEWEKTINEAESPVALHAATHRAIELLRSRIDAVGDQYNRGLGKMTDPVQLLSPKARATMERLEGGGAPSQDAPAAQQAPAIDPAALAEARRRGLIK